MKGVFAEVSTVIGKSGPENVVEVDLNDAQKCRESRPSKRT